MRTLDFVIIGAQKGGTTSVAEYLRESREVFIPLEKELPFYLDPEFQKRGLAWFMAEYFGTAPEDARLGTSTPQYLMFPECFRRMSEELPRVKHVAILRDPVRRLISHYDMALRLGVESRPLDDVVSRQLDELERMRTSPYDFKTTDKFVCGGEYGRQLTELLRWFPREQLLVIDFSRLVADAQAVTDEIASFIGVSPFSVKGVDKVQMKGGNRRRVDVDHNKFFSSAADMARRYSVIQSLIPDGVRSLARRANAWLDNVNVDTSSRSTVDDISPSVLARLREVYAEDRGRLNELGWTPSWPE